jgi:hypothetical protein
MFQDNELGFSSYTAFMKFRFKAFGLHIFGSTCLFLLALSCLYLGWYRWPGWYLTGALTIVAMMAGIDIALGPLLTFIIANPVKPRRELARDISMIVVVQLVAASYGIATLWHGRPLYYTYSERFLEMVQATDLSAEQIALGQKLNPELAPHWYSLPRWIYAPLPKDPKVSEQIVSSAVVGGDDVIQMPRYYRPWEEGLPELRQKLRAVAKMTELGKRDKEAAAGRMMKFGVTVDQPVALPMMGRGKPLVGIIDPTTGAVRALIKVD